MLYTVLGVQEAQTDTVLYTVWGSERVKERARGRVVGRGGRGGDGVCHGHQATIFLFFWFTQLTCLLDQY